MYKHNTPSEAVRHGAGIALVLFACFAVNYCPASYGPDLRLARELSIADAADAHYKPTTDDKQTQTEY